MSHAATYRHEIRATLALGAPIIVGQVSQMLMGVTDAVMIGHVGTVPLAASSFANSIFNVFYVVGIGLMVPVSIWVARARGAAQPDEAAEYLRHGVALAVVFGLMELLGIALLSLRLDWFRQPPEVLAIVTPFLLWLAASLPPVLVYLALRQFAEAMGHPWAPMFIMLAGVLLNVFLNWVFIYGHLGVPALGLTGAGFSTFLSRALGALTIFVWLRYDPAVRAAWPRRWMGGYALPRVREMLQLGLPAAGMLLFEASAFAFSGVMVGWLGAVPLAAHQIALTCASFTFMVPLGLSMAAGMRVSHAMGAGERARVRPIALGAIALAFALMLAFGLTFWLAGGAIAGWFVRDAVTIALAVQLLAVAAVFQMVDGVQVTAAASLRGITDVRVPTIITFVAYWVIALPVGYALGIRGSFGATGIWIGIASGLGFAAIFLTARFARLTRAW